MWEKKSKKKEGKLNKKEIDNTERENVRKDWAIEE